MSFGFKELLLIVLIILILFGAGKLPSVMREIGKGIKSFDLCGKITLSGFLETKEFAAMQQEKTLREMLEMSRDIDKITGKTLTKMEKANFDVFIPSKNIYASKASAGEQKRMLFSAFISAIRLSGANILLIDEVASKFDQKNRTLIFAELKNLECQIFVTGTERIEEDLNFIEI